MDDAKTWIAGVFDRAAPSYDQVAGRYHEYFGERLVDLTGVGRGDAVLDVACGRGAALLPAADRVGSTGTLVGIDLSPEMVLRAREAMADAGATADVQLWMPSSSSSQLRRSESSFARSASSSFRMPHEPSLSFAVSCCREAS